jgi:hydrogen cyanide synthase HcnC
MTRSKHDVIVAGCGVIGAAVAFSLAKRGRSVLIIDHARPGRATSASAGGLWPIGESIGLGCGVIFHAQDIANGHATSTALPPAFRRFLVESNARFEALSAELLALGGVDIEYAKGNGLMFLIFNEAERRFLTALNAVLEPHERPSLLSPEEARAMEPAVSGEILGGAVIPGEYQVNPMLVAEAFKRAAIALGAVFRPGEPIVRLLHRGTRVTGVATSQGEYTAGAVVNATGSWAGQLAGTVGLDLPVYPVRGQIVLTETLPRVLNSCLSTSDCYITQKLHGEVLIGSTTETVGFDVSVTEDAVRSLSRGVVRALPGLARVRVKRLWAGLRPGTPDELPILGPVAGLDGYFNAAGAFRTGIVASPLTGELVAQAILGEQPSVPLEPFLWERFRRNSCAGQALEVAGELPSPERGERELRAPTVNRDAAVAQTPG